MKFNFGTGLILFFALWALGIIFLVYKSSKENIDLVAGDYYNKEIAFQSQIDKEKNVSELSHPLQITFNGANETVHVQFPSDFRLQTVKGNIYFFKPDDASKDFNVKIETDSSQTQEISASQMKRGLWRAQAWLAATNTRG